MRSHKRFGTMAASIGVGILCGTMAYAQYRPSPSAPPTSPGQPGQMPGQNPNLPPDMTPGQNPEQNRMEAHAREKMFVRQAIEGNLAEIDTAKLALKKSDNANVKQFADRMVQDHTKMNHEMKAVAERLQVDVPTEPTKQARKEDKKLAAMSGTEFDRAYAKAMVKKHKATLHKFEEESSAAQDPQLRQVIDQSTPIVKQHLSLAEELEKSQTAALGPHS